MHAVVSCRSGNSVSKAVALFKKKFESKTIYLDEINLLFPFVETSFLIHVTAHQNKLNMWNKK